MREITKVMPRKPSVIQYYQTRYWDERLKADFQAASGTTGAEFSRLHEMNRFVRKKWLAESSKFKDQVLKEVEEAYAEAMAEFRKRSEWNETALSYHLVWQKLKELLPAITDTVGKLFGGGTVLFVFAPGHTGKVRFTSCTGMIPDSQASKLSVREFDEDAYKVASSLCVRYGEAAFSQDLRKSRIVSPQDLVQLAGVDDEDTEDESDDAADAPAGNSVPDTQPHTASSLTSSSTTPLSTTPSSSSATPPSSSATPSSLSAAPSSLLTMPSTSLPSSGPSPAVASLPLHHGVPNNADPPIVPAHHPGKSQITQQQPQIHVPQSHQMAQQQQNTIPQPVQQLASCHTTSFPQPPQMDQQQQQNNAQVEQPQQTHLYSMNTHATNSLQPSLFTPQQQQDVQTMSSSNIFQHTQGIQDQQQTDVQQKTEMDWLSSADITGLFSDLEMNGMSNTLINSIAKALPTAPYSTHLQNHPQKIASWANNKWGEKKPAESPALNALFDEMREITKVMPRKPSVIQYYQTRYWDERLKADFQAASGTTGAEFSRLREMNRFVRKKWLAESSEFKDQVLKEVEEAYAEAMAEFRKRSEWNETALSYHLMWQKSKELLPAITDAVGKLFGGGAVLFVFAPGHTGEVRFTSCTGMIPDSQASKPSVREFDEDAYKVASSLCVRYGEAAFSQDLRKSRIVSPQDLVQLAGVDDEDTEDESDGAADAPAGNSVPDTQPHTASSSTSSSTTPLSTTPSSSSTTPPSSSATPSSSSAAPSSLLTTPSTSLPSSGPSPAVASLPLHHSVPNNADLPIVPAHRPGESQITQQQPQIHVPQSHQMAQQQQNTIPQPVQQLASCHTTSFPQPPQMDQQQQQNNALQPAQVEQPQQTHLYSMNTHATNSLQPSLFTRQQQQDVQTMSSSNIFQHTQGIQDQQQTNVQQKTEMDWLSSADITGLFSDLEMNGVSNTLINATPEDLQALCQNPYYQYRNTAMTALPYDNPMFSNGSMLNWPASEGSLPSANDLYHNPQASQITNPSVYPPFQADHTASTTSCAPQAIVPLPPSSAPQMLSNASTHSSTPSSDAAAVPSTPVLVELLVQMAIVVEKPTVDGKENSPSDTSTPPSAPIPAKRARKTKRKADTTETTAAASGEPKPKKRRTKQLPADPKDLIASRKPNRNVTKPLHFIEQHSNQSVEEKTKKAAAKEAGKAER
ncbi:hypothetical protein V5O48_011484 [Marasmius crinis-equi]|uniref:Uncharacterized protein n=1 Tax=Marasmius crinis-equi TaxID=585013 RepID=A0ABR3F5G4_9AGAR